ncbi:peptide deformylase [Nesterenkonia alkaliphila]|uniref:Peptide deformylase n=1 Tax=Nesterenkonia alkaliphila TaxID=1463631 RepID=A0A7K1UKU7_9MICC|nr:peptide deformylase [Nesterenkonia alkaliphila]MVT27108.1 peptide deformylase [Nesterenkonia alkaliphila]GFZ89142.1 peptide deformylase [Nesterenkonia alkaliphila]
MAVHPIVIHGEPVLHRRAAEVETIDQQIRTLISDMDETLEASHGVGLAAPQIGVGLRIFNWKYPETGAAPNRGVIINPRLRLIGRVSQEAPDPENELEGCLSAPGYSFPLKRSDHVEITGFDAEGQPLSFEATGWFARILQHEYDHLEGYLYVNRLNDRYAKRWKKVVKREGWREPGNSWLPGVDPDPFGHEGEE